MSTLEAVLQDLARAGAPSVTAPPYLAERVLARRRRSARWRQAGAAAALLGTVVGVTAVRSSGGRYFAEYQPSGSMLPTVPIAGSVTADRTLTAVDGDLVVFELTEQGGPAFHSVRRVLAVAGETIGCPAAPDGRCHAWVRDGVVLDEPYTMDLVRDPFPDLTVPAGQLFVLGDNRGNAVDSAMYGPVPVDAVLGVGVEITGTDGRTGPVPGAPPHERPGGVDLDPHGGPPPARTVPVTSPG